MTKKLKYPIGGFTPEVRQQGIKTTSPLDSVLNPVRPVDPNTKNYLDAHLATNIHKADAVKKDRWRNPFLSLKNTPELEESFQLGLYGADAILNYHDSQINNQNYNQRLRNVFTQKPIYDYNNLWGPDANGGAEYQPLIMAKHGAEIRKGTHPMGTNVEIEGGEFIQLPDMSTEHIYGPSHEQGGVNTNLPQGARVFSDTLKPKGEKRTYAQLAKKYDTEKFKKILENPYSSDIDQNTAKLMFTRYQGALDELFKDQQRQNGNSDGTKFKDGGKVPYEEWKKTQSPLIKEDVLQKKYQNYLETSSTPLQPTAEENPILRNTGRTSETRTDAAKSIYDLFSGNEGLKNAFFENYKKQFPNTKGTVDDILKNFYEVEKHIEELRAKATPEELQSLELDKSKDNAAYNKLARKYGLTPIERNNIGRFQGAYRTFAELKSDPKYSTQLGNFDLNPVGVDDQKYGKENYTNSPISPADFIMGNTSLGQLVRYSDNYYSQNNPTSESSKIGEKTKTPTSPKGNEFESVLPWEQTMSSMGKFPLYQAAPEVLGYLSAIDPYSYYTPDFTHTEVAPPTLNIQPQLNSINSSFQSVIRQNTVNASINNSRNVAMFNQALEAKQQAFGNKQNFDANARFQADQYNAEQRTRENQLDLTSAATVHNEYRAAALDNASTERLNAAFSLTDKIGKYYQDEYIKMLYFDTIIPDFYYTGDSQAPIKLDPNSKQKFYSKYPKP